MKYYAGQNADATADELRNAVRDLGKVSGNPADEDQPQESEWALYELV